MMKYKKITINHDIYIKVLVYTDDVLNISNNKTEFPERRRFFEEVFEIKVQEASFLKNINFRVFQSPLGFSVDQTKQMIPN